MDRSTRSASPAHRRQVYIPDTNVLLTRALSADRFVRWLEARPGEDGLPLRVLHRVDGGTDTAEEILPHLEGYFGS